MTTKTPTQKLISFRVPVEVANFAQSNAKKQGRTLSNYIRWLISQEMDETKYLLSTQANRDNLSKSIEEAQAGIYSTKNLNLD